jgi:ABC-type arginine transport system permease subunit
VRDAVSLPLRLSDNGEWAQLVLTSIALVYLQGSAVSRVAVLRGAKSRHDGGSVGSAQAVALSKVKVFLVVMCTARALERQTRADPSACLMPG